MTFQTEVTEIIQRAPTVRSIRFRQPDCFQYLPGQFVNVILGEDPDRISKPLSLSSSPTEDFLEVTKRLTGHPFSNFLDALKVGDKIQFNGPFGRLTFQEGQVKIGMLSGGIGITPLLSLIKYAADKGLDKDIVLLYSNRSEEDVAFRAELKDLQSRNPKFRIIETITRPGIGWKGMTGRVNDIMVRTIVPDYIERTFYSSGPGAMVVAMAALLKSLKVPEDKIMLEIFPGYD